MTTPSGPIRKFNPGTLQTDQEVIEQFVVREDVLNDILEVLRKNITSSSCEHALVVAPRGRGKTMLLVRVAAELRTNADFSNKLLSIRFMEESQEIFNLTDFWLEVLFYLGKEAAYDSGLAGELREVHDDLNRHHYERATETSALRAVLDAASRMGKKIVLMVENLQAVYENVDSEDFNRKLRDTLQSEPQIILLATATGSFQALEDTRKPFLQLFQHRFALDPLNTEACRRLWQTLSGDDVTNRDIRPLEILTGGSPRLLAIVASFARHLSLRQLMQELVKLIDEHTEYFRAHLDAFGRTERRVYIAVIDLWQPSTSREIATRARMDSRLVSTQLGRLIERGAVVAEGEARSRRYVATERLHSIYYKLRRERDEAAIVRNMIHFMVLFYDRDELSLMFPRLIEEASAWPGTREFIEEAFDGARKTSSFDQPSEEKSEYEGGILIVDGDGSHVRLDDLFEIERSYHERNFPRVVELTDELLISLEKYLDKVPKTLIAPIYFMRAFACGALDDDIEKTTAAYEEAIELFGSSDEPLLQAWVATALANRGHLLKEAGDLDEALASYAELIRRFSASTDSEVQEAVAAAMVNTANANDPQLAISMLDDVIERYGSGETPRLQMAVAQALYNKGSTQGGLGELEAAIQSYEEVIDRFGQIDMLDLQTTAGNALLQKGRAQEMLGDLQASVAACDEMIARFGASESQELQVQVAWALSFKGMRQNKIGHAEEALQTCRELDTRIRDLKDDDTIRFGWQAVNIRVTALLLLKSFEMAMDIFRSAYAECDCNDNVDFAGMMQLVLNSVVAGASEHDLVEILSRDREKSQALTPFIVALRERLGETVRAPAEMLEIAADIRERIESDIAENSLQGPPSHLG